MDPFSAAAASAANAAVREVGQTIREAFGQAETAQVNATREVQDQLEGITHSSTRVHYSGRYPKYAISTGEHSTHLHNGPITLDTPPNFQNAVCIEVSPSFAHREQIYSDLSGYPVAATPEAYMATYNRSNEVGSVNLGNTRTFLEFTNCGNANVICDIYDVVYMDHITRPSAGWSDPNPLDNLPEWAWEAGLAMQNIPDSSPGGVNTDYRQRIGTKPNDSVLFRNMFNIVGRAKVVLPPGHNHIHHANSSGFFWMPREIMSTAYYVPKFTRYIMIVIRGELSITSEGSMITAQASIRGEWWRQANTYLLEHRKSLSFDHLQPLKVAATVSGGEVVTNIPRRFNKYTNSWYNVDTVTAAADPNIDIDGDGDADPTGVANEA